MKYQIKNKNQIHCIDRKNLNLMNAIEHFANHGYEYLYITESGIIVDYISYHEFVKYDFTKRKRNYVVEKSQIDIVGIENYITTNNDYSRIVVVEGDKFQYEINLMTEPELLHAIECELIALRMLPLFLKDIIQQLKKYDVITVFADDYVSSFLQYNLSGIDFRIVENIADFALKGTDSILDFRYGKKLLNKAIGEHQRIELYPIIEKLAVRRLAEYCTNNDILLKMYRIPEYHQIHKLSNDERFVADNKISFLELIGNERYLDQFCLSEEDKQFVLMRGASRSVRWDSGIEIIQGDCNEFGVEVSRGIRVNSQHACGEQRTAHFFGPCIVFGMFVVDDETIPAFFEKRCLQESQRMSVQNHGGLNGNNVVNSIMGALSTPMRKNDVIIIIDFFNRLPKEDYMYVEELNDAINMLGNDQVRFLDHPVHCNTLANKEIADYLYKQVMNCKNFNQGNMLDVNYFNDSKLVEVRDFSTTHSAAIKARGMLERMLNRCLEYNWEKLGIIIVTDSLEEEKIKRYIDSAVTKCDILILYYAYEHLALPEQISNINKIEKYSERKEIVAIQMLPYFNEKNYGDGCIYGGNLQFLSDIEIDLIQAVLIPNHIGIRFCYKEMDSSIENKYIENGISVERLY